MGTGPYTDTHGTFSVDTHATHATKSALPPGGTAELGAAQAEWASLLHTGGPEDHSAMFPFQAQVRRPDPTIWWPEGQWNMMTVPTEVPSPRSTWKVPCRGCCTCTHMPRREERGDNVRPHPWGGAWWGLHLPQPPYVLWRRSHSHPDKGQWHPRGQSVIPTLSEI